jgi:hypothetical protein
VNNQDKQQFKKKEKDFYCVLSHVYVQVAKKEKGVLFNNRSKEPGKEN